MHDCSRWLVFLALAVSGAAAHAQVRRIRLNGLDLAVSERNGGLIQLGMPGGPSFLQAAEGSAGLVDVAYPVESMALLRLGSANSRAAVQRESNGVTVRWDGLGPNRAGRQPPGKVVAEVTLRAAPDGKSVALACRIRNESATAVPQVLFPDLPGMRPVEGAETQLRFARGAERPFQKPIRDPHTAPFYVRRGWKEYAPSGYYGWNTLRWLDYGGYRAGLSVHQRKWGTLDAPAVRTFRSEADPNTLRLIWDHQANIAPGATWESGEFWLTPHAGGWAKGIEPFREYVRSVRPRRLPPRHVREGIGFQTVWLLQALERDPARAAFRFSDLPRIARDAWEHGITELVPWGWCTYFTLPVEVRHELGSEAEFAEAIRQARAAGVNVAPFTSVQTLVNRQLARYGGKEGTSNWTYDPALIPNFNPIYVTAFQGGWIDSGNRLWQQEVRKELRRWIGLGLYSFSWDQFSNRTNDHRKAGFLELVQEIRTAARAKDPESTFSAESIRPMGFEEEGAVLDYTWNWVDYVDAGPMLNVLEAPRLNCNVEDSPLVVKKAFCDGLYLNVMPKRPDQPNGTALIRERPELAAALKTVAALRQQFLPFFLDGFLLGDSFLSQAPPLFVRAWQEDRKLLVLVLNDAAKPTSVTLRSQLAWWLPAAASYSVRRYDGAGRPGSLHQTKGPDWSVETGMLEPLDLAVFEIEAQVR